jgi:hypothetical protein
LPDEIGTGQAEITTKIVKKQGITDLVS